MAGRAPEVGVRESLDTWWSMLQPAVMEGKPRRVLPGRGPEPLALGKRTPAARGVGEGLWGRMDWRGQAQKLLQWSRQWMTTTLWKILGRSITELHQSTKLLFTLMALSQ